MRYHTKDGLINFHYPQQLLIFLFIPLELSTCGFLIFPTQKLCNIYKFALTILSSIYSDQKALSFVMFSATRQ